MPVPLKPSSKTDSILAGIDIATLLSPRPPAAGLTATADAADPEADMLMDLWERSSIMRDADSIESRGYEPPNGYAENDILRLKAAGLIAGSNTGIRFTPKGARVIKTMVLGESNSFQNMAVKKPYSVILADVKSPKRRTNLALASSHIRI